MIRLRLLDGMKDQRIPGATIVLCVATLIWSMGVAFAVTGHPLGTVKVPLLEPYGGVTAAHLADFELWRLFASQLVHVKQLHMLYNVLSLALLGCCIERHVGGLRFFALWLVAGSIGTLVGTLFATPPWNLGTGASQAVLGIAGFGMVLFLRGVISSRGFSCVLCFTIIPAFALDLVYAGYPKPGHLVGFLIGGTAGAAYCSRRNRG